MLILVDECLPLSIRRLFPRHDARTVDFMGWKGLDDEALLPRAAENGFEVFLTAHRHVSDHFDIARSSLAVVVVPSSLRPMLLKMADTIRANVYAAKPGQHVFMPR